MHSRPQLFDPGQVATLIDALMPSQIQELIRVVLAITLPVTNMHVILPYLIFDAHECMMGTCYTQVLMIFWTWIYFIPTFLTLLKAIT